MKEEIKEQNYNLISYWALAYNCIVLDKILICISIIGLIFLGFFTEIEDTLSFLYKLKSISIISFSFTIITSLVLLKTNNKVLQATLNDQDMKNGLEIIDNLNFICCLIGICLLTILILIK